MQKKESMNGGSQKMLKIVSSINFMTLFICMLVIGYMGYAYYIIKMTIDGDDGYQTNFQYDIEYNLQRYCNGVPEKYWMKEKDKFYEICGMYYSYVVSSQNGEQSGNMELIELYILQNYGYNFYIFEGEKNGDNK